MLYTTGLRSHELRTLTYDDINIPQLRGIVFGKGDKYGPFTFSLPAQKKLDEYLRVRAYYFPDVRFRYLFTLFEHGQALCISEQKLNLALKKIAKDASVHQRVYAHLFRHTLATHLIMDKRSLTDVRDKLRHSNVATTSRYTHSDPESLLQMTKTLGADLMVSI